MQGRSIFAIVPVKPLVNKAETGKRDDRDDQFLSAGGKIYMLFLLWIFLLWEFPTGKAPLQLAEKHRHFSPNGDVSLI
jgi:hypothetical protein